jgi:nitrite reductase/ring-hydroxylating ferredoxin subunit
MTQAATPRRVDLGPLFYLPLSGFVTVPIIPPYRLPDSTYARSVLLGYVDGTWKAFANVCRHLAVPLDLHQRPVSDPENKTLLCQHHGALFETNHGRCTKGPCLNKALWQFPVEVDSFQFARLVLLPSLDEEITVPSQE